MSGGNAVCFDFISSVLEEREQVKKRLAKPRFTRKIQKTRTLVAERQAMGNSDSTLKGLDLNIIIPKLSPHLRDISSIDAILPSLCEQIKVVVNAVYVDCYFEILKTDAPPEQRPLVTFDTASQKTERLKTYSHARIFGESAKKPILQSLSATSKRGSIKLRGFQTEVQHTVVLINATANSNSPGVWFHIVFPHDGIDSAWIGETLIGLRALVELLTLSISGQATNKGLQIRLAFYQNMLAIDGEDFDKSYTAVANAWCKAMQASWVWVWVFNSLTNIWELCRVSPTDFKYNPDPWPIVGNDGIVAYATRNKAPEFISALDEMRTLDDKTFRVSKRLELEQCGCSSFWCIPILRDAPANSTDSLRYHGARWRSWEVKAAICAHYTRDCPPPEWGEMNEVLALMAGLTGLVFQEIYEKQCNRVLLRLNSLTEHISNRNDPPIEVQRTYVDSLLTIVKEEVRCAYSTLFFENSAKRGVDLLGSSDILYNSGGVRLTKAQMKSLSYSIGEGKTGKVYQRGEPEIWTNFAIPDQDYKFKSSENYPTVRDGKFTASGVIYPIPCPPPLKGGTPNRPALGVLRCVAAVDSVGTKMVDRDFDVSRLNVLDFIASQIGPILDTFQDSVRRSTDVRNAKHDLQTPLAVIEHQIIKVQGWADGAIPRHQRLYKLIVQTLDKKELGAKDAITVLTQVKAHLEQCDSIATPERGSHDFVESSSETTDISDDYGKVAARFSPLRLVLSDIEYYAASAWKCSNLLDGQKKFLDTYRPEKTFLQGRILSRLKNGYAMLAESKRLRFTVEPFKGAIPPLRVDPYFVERVFQNLLENAAKYTEPDHDVVIQPLLFDITAHDGIRINVINDGIGIPENESLSIFLGEFRGQTALSKGIPGHGLGLKIAQAMMEKIGGSIILTRNSNPTIFTVFFPKSLITA